MKTIGLRLRNVPLVVVNRFLSGRRRWYITNAMTPISSKIKAMNSVGTRVARMIIRLFWNEVSISSVEPIVGWMFVVLLAQGPSMTAVDVGWYGNTD